MSTISEKLVQLNDSKQAIKGAIEAKGVTVGDAPLSDYAGKITQIEGGGGESSRFGLTLDNFIRNVDADGKISRAQAITDLRFDGVKTLGEFALEYVFYDKSLVGSVSFPELTTVGYYAMQYAFYGCYDLTGISFPLLTTIDVNGMAHAFYKCIRLVDASFPVLTTIDNTGMDRAFYGCTALTGISFPELTTIGVSGMSYAFYQCPGLTEALFPKLTTIGISGMDRAFYQCLALTSVSFPKLTTIGSSGMHYAFQATSSNPGVLKRIDFPALTDVQANSFGSGASYYAFRYRTTLEEIHFRADMQATIEAMSGYADKWGAENATIYFDL